MANQKFCNIIIPMVEDDPSFSRFGHLPKPRSVQDIKGRPMINLVIENFGLDVSKINFFYVVQKSHSEKYNFKQLLNMLTPDCKLIETEHKKNDLECVLLAKNFINNDLPLMIINSAAFFEWRPLHFSAFMTSTEIDFGLVTFNSDDPRLKYIKSDDENNVLGVTTNLNSEHAVAGVYYFKNSDNFLKLCSKLDTNVTYISLIYKAIENKNNIKHYNIPKVWHLRTLNEVEYFLKEYAK